MLPAQIQHQTSHRNCNRRPCARPVGGTGARISPLAGEIRARDRTRRPEEASAKADRDNYPDRVSESKRLPTAVIVALVVIAVGGLILAMNWLLGAFFTILRIAVVTAIVVVLAVLVIRAKARR